MAIGAAPVKVKIGVRPVSKPVDAIVALIAKPRHPCFEQPVIDGAVGIMTVGAVIENRRMLPEKGTAPFCVAAVTILIDAGLYELGGIRRAVRVMAARAGDLPFSERHVGGALELRLALQMALQANFGFRLFGKENRFVGQFRELIFIACPLHYRVAIDARDAAARVRARLPIGLNPALVACKTNLILHLGRLSRIFAETDQPANAFTATGGHMVTSRPMTGLAGLLLLFVARIEEKNLPHHRLGKFLKLRCVTGLTDLVADIGCRACGCCLRRRRLCGPDHLNAGQQDGAGKTSKQKAPHISSQFSKKFYKSLMH